jgi:lysozyme family protein
MVVHWWFIGVVHAMECGLDFTTNLANGDPLTVRVPKGHPAVVDHFPIDWAYAARDAISYEKLDLVTNWSLPNVLFQWHRYNGIANKYKELSIPTPYLWSGSQHYVKGKYVSDHTFDPDAVSKQVGAAVILRALIDMGAVVLKNMTTDVKGNPAAAAEHVGILADIDYSQKAFKHPKAELNYPGALSKSSPSSDDVSRVQEWLNLHGFVTSIDQSFGDSTAQQLGRFAVANGRAATNMLDEELWTLLTAPLRKALAPIPPMASFEEMIVAVAAQHIAQKPTEIGGNNRGPWVRAYMRGQANLKWCAGFVSFVVEQASRDLDKPVPFDREVGVDALVKDANTDGRFIGIKVFGWVLTAVALSLGAPFWFDVLAKFMSIRGTGKKPKPANQ